ncbi:hypothetical protein GQS52_22620 [Streptomyces sp. SCUT-3]|uniref:hypothetical protein n=1 Tax=Streptomyces TaxID=1883 RepID=UPI000CB89C9B|nr:MULTISPECIES: hypothetical protein [unclassified Streptomyces]MCZ2525816.1 hypothetical protein [Streptomyces sp. HB2AG]PLW73575.1 hypothetical protein C0036_06505 [Streptomyces sp. DJ]QMV24109.1 hypothetical protein GQS52_22620 [Streptomyces sp. SCUT-3]
MSDAAQPTVDEVRAAAEAVKAALDRHLAAVENRSGANDPAVYAAADALARAVDAYDQALDDGHGELLPFEVPVGETLPAYAGPEEPEAVSVLIRRDYLVADPDRLLGRARRVVEPTGGPVGTLNGALGVLFGEYEPDEIASRCEEFGLEEGDSTLWVTAAEPHGPGEWLHEPFEDADPELIICRFDVSSVYDDELAVLDPDR